MSNIYEPELMYALDSLDEYSDWKNVYNVSGDDICYCPICLGRVKLWNGQDPNKTYKKQRCFHHIDRMCTQESRVHFAYKTWLLKENSKFKVNDTVYSVKNVELEKTVDTSFGKYRPDMIVTTTDDKVFYIEVADTNFKTDEYITKWDELGNDVLEINVNEQMYCAKENSIPEFKLIYSSSTGECFAKSYIHKEYDDLITERKKYWSRQKLIDYKIKWEKLDWFWRNLQEYYSNKKTLEDVCKSFSHLVFEDQLFICSRFKTGKHKNIKMELEKYYNNKFARKEAVKKQRMKYISSIIKSLNNEFGYSQSNGRPYLCRNKYHITFHGIKFENDFDIPENISDDVLDKKIRDFFYPIMKDDYEYAETIRLEKEKHELKFKKIIDDFNPIFSKLQNKINNCKNKMWKMEYHFFDTNVLVELYARNFELRYIGGTTTRRFSISGLKSNINNLEDYVTKILEEELIDMLDNMKNSNNYCRVMEER